MASFGMDIFISLYALANEKVSENRKLRRLENQKVGGSKTCQPSYLPTFSPPCSSPSCFLIFQNICVHPLPAIALAQARRAGWFPYALSSFLFPLFYFLFYWFLEFAFLGYNPDRHFPRHLNDFVAHPAHVKLFHIRKTSSSDDNGSISPI